jgi:hypothetical protein
MVGARGFEPRTSSLSERRSFVAIRLQPPAVDEAGLQSETRTEEYEAYDRESHGHLGSVGRRCSANMPHAVTSVSHAWREISMHVQSNTTGHEDAHALAHDDRPAAPVWRRRAVFVSLPLFRSWSRAPKSASTPVSTGRAGTARKWIDTADNGRGQNVAAVQELCGIQAGRLRRLMTARAGIAPRRSAVRFRYAPPLHPLNRRCTRSGTIAAKEASIAADCRPMKG